MVKDLFKKFLLVFFRLFRYHYRKRLIVLAYHDVKSTGYLEEHLQFLTRYYSVVSIHQLHAHIQTGTELPDYALLVTFDDGDPTLKVNGMPLLTKYNIPAVFFVVSENVRNKDKFWWKVIEDYFLSIGKTYEDARQEVRRLKKVTNRERMQVINDIGNQAPHCLSDPKALTAEELHAMTIQGITIGSHTATHPILNKCSPEELENEFTQSQKFFTDSGLDDFRFFAYPNGDYSSDLIPLLQKYGVKLAFAFDHKINPEVIDSNAISRIRMNSDDSPTEFKLRICGISSLFINK